MFIGLLRKGKSIMNGNNMRKMYTEEQVAKIVKANSTKLYKHKLVDSVNNYVFILVNTDSKPIDFSVYTTVILFKEYLKQNPTLSFYQEVNPLSIVSIDEGVNVWATLYVYNGNATSGDISDWDLTTTTDTVTEL